MMKYSILAVVFAVTQCVVVAASRTSHLRASMRHPYDPDSHPDVGGDAAAAAEVIADDDNTHPDADVPPMSMADDIVDPESRHTINHWGNSEPPAQNIGVAEAVDEDDSLPGVSFSDDNWNEPPNQPLINDDISSDIPPPAGNVPTTAHDVGVGADEEDPLSSSEINNDDWRGLPDGHAMIDPRNNLKYPWNRPPHSKQDLIQKDWYDSPYLNPSSTSFNDDVKQYSITQHFGGKKLRGAGNIKGYTPGGYGYDGRNIDPWLNPNDIRPGYIPPPAGIVPTTDPVDDPPGESDNADGVRLS